MRFFETAILVSIVVAVSLASHEKEDGHRRSYTVNPGKVGHEDKSKYSLSR